MKRNLWRRGSNIFGLFLCLALASCGGGGAQNSSSAPVTYTIGGTVSGLSGAGLVLQDNGGNNLSISTNGSFTFSTAIANGSTFDVTVLTQPSNPAQTCGVTNGSGTASANVTSVQVTCTTNTYTIGGTISGLSGSGLVLQDNGGNNLTVSANGSFTFTAALASGTAYSVTVFSQPANPAQTCGVTAGGSGTVASTNVTSVVVTCTTIYTIGGTVSGLSGTGLVLQDNGGDNLAVGANGNFTFATAIANGSTFDVTVLTQPSNPAQTCVVTNGSGTASANVTGVQVTCTTNTYTIGGTISGLSGTGLVLQDNGGNSLTVSANGPFTFTTALASGATYTVTVFSQPSNPAQTCGVTAGAAGTVTSANVTSVVVTCASLISGAISPLDYGGIADAITISPVDLSGGGSTLVSAGLFTPDLVGKVVVCLQNNDSQDGLNLTTVTGYTDSSHITVAGTIVRAFANHACAFASQNFRTALLAAQAVVPVNGTLQLPCGTMLISGGQILSTSQFTAAPTGPFSISGCPGKGTHFIMDWASMSTTTTPAVSLMGTSNYISDIVFDSIGGGSFQPGGSSLNAVVSISGHVENLEVNRWFASGGSGTQACFTSSQDGSSWVNILSAGCNVGLHLFNRGSFNQDGGNIVRGTTASMIVEGQEDGDVIIGGSFAGPVQVYSNAGNPTTITFLGVDVSGPMGAAALQIRNSTGPLNVNWTGGSIGCSGNALCASNSSGVSIGTNVTFRASQTRFDSSGTGSGIINSGTFIDDCGNYFTQTGASEYTGSGVLIGCASPSSFPVCQLGGATGTVSPAQCLQAQSGVIAVPASQTTYTVDTNAVTAASQIIVQQTTDNTGISSATCDPGPIAPMVTGRIAGTSFTISLNSVTAVTCFQYTIVD